MHHLYKLWTPVYCIEQFDLDCEKINLLRMMTRKRKNEKGQAFLIVGMMMVTFFSLFMFVVHTGQLINAKINLQNAADLAAYAGASVQARQLNSISFLNYEMRRQYKKFLFRYVTIGNLAQKSTLALPNDDRYRSFSPTGNPSDDYGVPVVCIIFNQSDNFCQLNKLPAIPIPSSNPLDSISVALKTQLTQLETIRKANCERIDGTNQITLALWLFNTDPTLANLNVTLTDPKNQIFFQSVKGIGSGLGLIPRLILLRQRIKTLESYVNLPRNGRNPAITRDVINQLEQLPANSKPQFERPALAFLTAYRTLGEYAFNSESITLEELLPGSQDQSSLLSLQEVKTGFEAYYLGFQNQIVSQSASTDCDPIPKAIPVRDLTVAFSKDPSILTYYSVRLTAEANLMFNPFPGTPLKLKAYAAAQPFGSRIGPVFEEGNLPFVRDNKVVNAVSSNQNNTCSQQVGRCLGIPALPIFDGDDSLNDGTGYLSNTFQRALFGKLREIGGGTQGGNGQLSPLSADDFEKAASFGMAPNPAEKGIYNIINDIGHSSDDPTHVETGDPFVSPFGDSLNTKIWAPLLPNDAPGGSLNDQITQAINSAATLNQDLKDSLSTGLRTYLGQLQDNQPGEDGETFYLAALRDPLSIQLNANQPKTSINLSGTSKPVVLTQSEDIKTSWADLRHAPLRERGRTGYSVKFVSFDYLLNKGKGRSASNFVDTPWINSLDTAIDEEGRFDLQVIKH